MEKNFSNQIELPVKGLFAENEPATVAQPVPTKIPVLHSLTGLLQAWNAPLVWKISLNSLLNLAAIGLVVVMVSLTLQNVLNEINSLNQTASDRIRLSEVQNNLVFAEQALQSSLWSNSLNQLDDYYFRVERIQRLVGTPDFASFFTQATLKQKQTNLGGARVETSLGEINELLQKYNNLTTLLGRGEIDPARQEWQTNIAVQSGRVNTGIASLAQSVDLSLQKVSDHISELTQQTTLWLIIGTLSLILLNVFLGWLQHLTISKPLSLTKYKLAYLKEDNEKQSFDQLRVSNRDEIGDLVATLVNTLQKQHDQNQLLYDRTQQVINRLNKDLYQLNNCQMAINTARHDLKSPLSNIRNQAELLLITNPELNGDTKKTLENVIGISDKGYSMISNILSDQITRTGLNQLHPTLTDMTKLLQEVVYLVDMRGRTVQVSFPENVQLMVDYSLMEHVLLNLLSNAAKFATSRIIISGAQRSLLPSSQAANDSSQQKQTYELIVWNDGATITEEDKDKIFQVGAQTEEGRRAGGNGLGLFIVKNIIQLHQGAIVVDTEHELVKQFGGTCFKISLPHSTTVTNS